VSAGKQKVLTSRRAFIRAMTLGVAGTAILSACSQPPATPTAAPTAAPAATTAATAAPTKAAAATTAPATTAAATAKPSAGTGKLTVWGQQSFTPEGDAMLGQQMQEFAKANNQQVEYVIVENAQVSQKLAAAIEAKATSDVQMLGSASDAQYYATRGDGLLDMTGIWEKATSQAGGFFDSVKEVYKADGKYVGIPFETHSFPLFTRLDLLEQATGKREPVKTLDELTDVAKKISKPPSMYALGLCVGRIADNADATINLMWCDGATYTDKSMKPTINSEGVISVLTRYQSWFKDKLIPPDAISWDDTGNNNAYQAKQVAFVINPPSIYGWMQTNDKELLNNSTMAAIPAGKAGSYSIAGSWSWSIFKATKNVDQAQALVTYLMDPERLQAVYEKIGGRWYPVHKDLQKKDYWTSRPQFKYYPDLINNGRFYTYPVAPDPKLMQALGEVGKRYVIPDMVQAVLVNNQTPEQAAAAAQKAFEEVWAQYKVGQ
jgi:multiple sugar transport system substrate-binding protein